MSDNNGEMVRLPLWKNALDLLIQNGLSYGLTVPAEWFEEQLRCKRDTMSFGLGVSEIRRGLEAHGYYLTGRGQGGNQFVIVQPEQNIDVMKAYQRAATDALKRGVILGTSTRLDMLPDKERARHVALLERLQVKRVLMARSESIRQIVAKAKPKLLERGPDEAEAAG